MDIQPSAFLTLPPELRIQIYTTLFRSTKTYLSARRLPPREIYGLLLSNQQIHTEALPLYYTHATFAIDSESVASGVSFLASLPEKYRAWMRKVLFERSMRTLPMYDLIHLRVLAREGDERRRQEVLLVPLRVWMEKWGVAFAEGVVRAEISVW